MPAQPTGTITFLFTDLEGSTKLWERHPTAMRGALARHDDLLRGAIATNDGYVFKTIGDAFCAAFAHPADAVGAAVAAQRDLAAEPWEQTGPLRARMALHTGEAEAREGDYFGQPVNRVARLLSAGHGNQILLSEATHQLARDALPEKCNLRHRGKHRLKDLSRPEPVYQVVSPELPVNLKRLKSLPSPTTGGVAALGTAAVGVVSFRAQTRSASEEVGLGLLSPLSLYTGGKGLVIELSTLNEYLLLGVGLLLLAVTLVIGLARWRAVRREIGLKATEGGRVADWLVNQRTLAFLAVAALTVLGAYGYQQYLWRVALPIPDDAIGFAITREASAASFQDQLADTLYTQGQAQQVVVRELPVKFDANDTATARRLGDRIGAEAVIIYRVDESAPDGSRDYVAYVVFTDPSIGLVVGDQDGASAASLGGPAGEQAPVQVKEGVEIPVLRTETLEELVNAAAGVIAYNEHRLREAIKHLELAVPQQPDAANTGIVQFYLGNAFSLDGQAGPAAGALEGAAGFYERRLQSGAVLGPQDALILVKAYTERGLLAALPGDWDAALTWYEKGLAVREDLVARAAGLERPSDVPATYARLFTLMADAYRGLGKSEDQDFWQRRASQEIDALVAGAAPDDPYPLIRESAARFFGGDCVAATAALDRALALDSDNVDAYTYAGVIHWTQGRLDLTLQDWQQLLVLDPDDINARMGIADLLAWRGNTPEYFEVGYLVESENQLRQVIRLDPTNVAAHEQLAEQASLRARAANFDLTAFVFGDALSVQKSQETWPNDPVRQEEALDAHGVVVETRRILASELRPGDPASQAAVAAAYMERQGFHFGVLLAQPVPAASPTPDATPQLDDATPQAAGTPAPLFPSIDLAAGQQLLDDDAQIREWTDLVLANPAAPRLALAHAWAARVVSAERVWAWYVFFAPDEAKAVAAEQEYRQAVTDAVAFAESAPVSALDEIAPLRLIYFWAMYLARYVDEDEASASAYEAKIRDLRADESEGRATGIEHQLTFCMEAREVAAGDDALAAGDDDEALEHYEAALTANPDHPPALLGAGRALYGRDDLPGAIARAEAATRAAPAEAAAWADLALYHLAAGDEAAANGAYDRFLEVVAAQRPQERMASLRAGLAELEDLLAEQSEPAPPVMAVLPGFAASLDGMEAEDNRSYQYPALYATLGNLALQAGSPVEAEAWLRRSLELDPHQPIAQADLVVAVVAQGRDATEQIEAALVESRDPLWPGMIDFLPGQVLEMMERETRSFEARFPEQQAGLDAFLTAIADERERQDSLQE